LKTIVEFLQFLMVNDVNTLEMMKDGTYFFFNINPSSIFSENKDMINNLSEMTQLQSAYLTMIDESFGVPGGAFTEAESQRLMEENDFLTTTIDDINILLQKSTRDEFQRFCTRVGLKLQHLFSITNFPETQEPLKILEKKNDSHAYFPEAPYEEPKPIPRSSGLNFPVAESKPNAHDFGTFGGQDIPPEPGYGIGFDEFPKKDRNSFSGSGIPENKDFDGFKKVNSGGFDQNDTNWNKGFDNFGVKSSNIVQHQNYTFEEKKPMKNEVTKSEIVKPALVKETKLKRSVETSEFGRGGPEMVSEPYSNVH
jgi:hypothetical protein